MQSICNHGNIRLRSMEAIRYALLRPSLRSKFPDSKYFLLGEFGPSVLFATATSFFGSHVGHVVRMVPDENVRNSNANSTITRVTGKQAVREGGSVCYLPCNMGCKPSNASGGIPDFAVPLFVNGGIRPINALIRIGGWIRDQHSEVIHAIHRLKVIWVDALWIPAKSPKLVSVWNRSAYQPEGCRTDADSPPSGNANSVSGSWPDNARIVAPRQFLARIRECLYAGSKFLKLGKIRPRHQAPLWLRAGRHAMQLADAFPILTQEFA